VKVEDVSSRKVRRNSSLAQKSLTPAKR